MRAFYNVDSRLAKGFCPALGLRRAGFVPQLAPGTGDQAPVARLQQAVIAGEAVRFGRQLFRLAELALLQPDLGQAVPQDRIARLDAQTALQ